MVAEEAADLRAGSVKAALDWPWSIVGLFD
jgi:hypothetical protein